MFQIVPVHLPFTVILLLVHIHTVRHELGNLCRSRHGDVMFILQRHYSPGRGAPAPLMHMSLRMLQDEEAAPDSNYYAI